MSYSKTYLETYLYFIVRRKFFLICRISGKSYDYFKPLMVLCNILIAIVLLLVETDMKEKMFFNCLISAT